MSCKQICVYTEFETKYFKQSNQGKLNKAGPENSSICFYIIFNHY